MGVESGIFLGKMGNQDIFTEYSNMLIYWKVEYKHENK